MKIILAVDGTAFGSAAADMLKRIALDDGDEVRILTVVDMAVPMAVDVYGGYLPDTTELEKAARENAEKVISSTKEKVEGIVGGKKVAITTSILFGSPDSRIVETGEETKADLIVLGSHGYKAWERLLLGSVSNSVVHHAHCSVLVVRVPSA